MKQYEQIGKNIGSNQELEKTANYEGNQALLLLKRINNPLVKEKLINDIYMDMISKENSYVYWAIDKLVKGSDETTGREIIKKELERKIEVVFSVTDIKYSEFGHLESNDGGDGGTVNLLCKGSSALNEFTKETVLIKSIIEAHEKGHKIREYSEESLLGKNILSAFDLNKVTATDEDLAIVNKVFNRENTTEELDDEKRQYLLSGLTYSNLNINEIIERMSQVKNYFGMSGDEVFTKEHLIYAKKNYIKDTGVLSLQIKPFFDAISDEDKFVELMNSLGI